VNNICVYADPQKAKPVAIIVAQEKPLQDIASQNGVSGEDIEQLIHDEKLNSVVLKLVQDAGKKAGLSGIEIISGIVLVDEEWTPQNVSTSNRPEDLVGRGILTNHVGPYNLGAETEQKGNHRQVQAGD
jgi:long-chain acyl-CoA synthetase